MSVLKTETLSFDPDNVFILRFDKNLNSKLIHSRNGADVDLNYISRKHLLEAIDKLGCESAQAQGLQCSITTLSKFSDGFRQDVIYMIGTLLDGKRLREIGFIRVGLRNLYLNNGKELKHVPNCRCVLDFYVQNQRLGYGKFLFNAMLDDWNVMPSGLAYDRPSEKMLAFLRRHHHLDQPSWQHNHFVIFPGLLNDDK